MDALRQFITPLAVFLLTLASGLWLSLSGKPPNALIFTVHKLIALAAVVAAAAQAYAALRGSELHPTLSAMLILTGLSVVALFATGALMSMDRYPYSVLLTIHRVGIFLAAASGLAAVVLIGARAT